MTKRLIELSDDKKEAFIAIDETLTTADFEKLIGDLLVLRDGMDPSVPYEPPNRHVDADQDTNVSVQTNPYVTMKLLKDRRIRFWLRNSGLGWMIFDLPVATACGIRDYLIANTPDDVNAPSLFTEEADKGDKSH